MRRHAHWLWIARFRFAEGETPKMQCEVAPLNGLPTSAASVAHTPAHTGAFATVSVASAATAAVVVNVAVSLHGRFALIQEFKNPFNTK